MQSHVEAIRRFSLPAATAGVVVEEVSRHWCYRTNDAGDLMLALVVVELVWYSIQIVQWIVKKIRGKDTRVRVTSHEWRSLERERVIKTRRPKRARRRELIGEPA